MDDYIIMKIISFMEHPIARLLRNEKNVILLKKALANEVKREISYHNGHKCISSGYITVYKTVGFKKIFYNLK